MAQAKHVQQGSLQALRPGTEPRSNQQRSNQQLAASSPEARRLAAARLAVVVEDIAADAARRPEDYLVESEVPAGGE